MRWIDLSDDTYDPLNRLAYTASILPGRHLITLVAQARQRTPLLQWPIDLMTCVTWCDPDLYEWLLEDRS